MTWLVGAASLAGPTTLRFEDRVLDVISESTSVADLALRAQRGDRAAFGALYHRFRGAVNATLLSRTRDHDVSDLLQEVFLTALARLDDLREPAAFGGWLLAIARSAAIDGGRRRRDRARADEAPEIAVDPPPRPEALEVLSHIRELPEAYREPLLMRLCEGMTGPEIASVTGLTPESVRVNLCRGMKLLRESLGEEER